MNDFLKANPLFACYVMLGLTLILLNFLLAVTYYTIGF